jgi:DNA-binding IclR family transcriptional regulator
LHHQILAVPLIATQPPSARLDDARVQQIVALLLDASRELSAKAGATTD